MKRSALHLRRPAFRKGRPAFVVFRASGRRRDRRRAFQRRWESGAFRCCLCYRLRIEGRLLVRVYAPGFGEMVSFSWWKRYNGRVTEATSFGKDKGSVNRRGTGPFLYAGAFSCLFFFASSCFAAVSRTFPDYFRERRALSGVLCVRFVAATPFAVYCVPLTICY